MTKTISPLRKTVSVQTPFGGGFIPRYYQATCPPCLKEAMRQGISYFLLTRETELEK